MQDCRTCLLKIMTWDEFEYWRFHFEDVMQEFEAFVPEALAAKLDRSVESLDALEAWLLEKYDSPEAILTLDQRGVLDGASRYVGETYAAHIGGKWQIDVEDTDDAFYGLPVIAYLGGSDCPLSLVTASLDRRTGTYLSNILRNKMRRLSARTNIPGPA